MKKWGVLTIVIIALALIWCPVFAQNVASTGGSSYKGVADFYSKRFFSIGQVAAQQTVKGTAAEDAAATTTDNSQTTQAGDASTLDNLPKVGDTKVITNNDGTKTTYVLKSIQQDGNQVSMDWEPADGTGDGIGEVINTDTTNNNQGTTNTNTTQNNTNTNTTNTNTTNTTQDATTTNATSIPATYDAAKGTVTYKDASGADKTINIADIGLSAEWMTELTKEGGTLSVTLNDDGSAKLITGSDANGAKKWEYDPSSHLVAHYQGDKGKEQCTVVTSDQAYYENYIWASDDAKDPGAGPDGHFVVQRFNYDANGALATVDYFTWTAGDRQGVDKARYMYRQDTVVQSDTSATDTSSVSADCTTSCNGVKVTTKYFNDPFPVDWDPVLTGTVTKDEYGNYFLKTCDGKTYLLTAREDGFDADKDGKSGADEMNSVDWESLVGKEITVRGHQVNDDSSSHIYKDGKAISTFEVVDMITPDEKTSLGDKYQSTVDNMKAVAEGGVDKTNEGLTGNNAPGELGWVNMFNGQTPQAGQFKDTTDLLYKGASNSGLASFYLDNIPADQLAAIRAFATPELETALKAAEDARKQANTQTTNTQDAANTNTNTNTNTQDAANNNTNTNTDTNTQDAANTNTNTNTNANANTNTNTNTTDVNATQNVDDLLKKSQDWLKQFGNGGVVATQ